MKRETRSNRLWLRNSSRYPNEEVWPLAILAYDLAVKVISKGVPPPRVLIDLTNSQHRYCGRYTGAVYLPERPGKYTEVQWKRILCRIGAPNHFPRKDSYQRYKEMPEYEIKCHREGLLHIIGHEISHAFGTPGGKEGEIKCEMFAQDVIDLYRREKDRVDQEIQARLAYAKNADRNRRDREQAKQEAQGSAEVRTEKALAALARWTRKESFARNKVKHYERLLARLSRRMEKELANMNP